MRKRRMMRPAKDLLSEKMILAWIMKECVQEYAGMDVREIVKYIEGAPQTAKFPLLRMKQLYSVSVEEVQKI